MTDDKELESIPGRARIVDAEGNPIDPDNPPWAQGTPETKAKPEPPPDDEPEDEGEGRHARAVRRRHTRSSE